MNLYKYKVSQEVFSSNKQTIKVMQWVQKNATVLEFGCHTGQLSQILFEDYHCNVTGVELDEKALKIAKPYLKKYIHIDIENYNDWSLQLKNKKYKFILFLHVLEHLKNSDLVLKKSVNLLEKNGEIIIGLPNITNLNDRLKILKGNFNYTNIGVMDNTHYHMFSYYSALKLIEDANLKILEYYSPWQLSPLKTLISHIPFLWKYAKYINSNPSSIYKNKRNITDIAMLFRCKKWEI